MTIATHQLQVKEAAAALAVTRRAGELMMGVSAQRAKLRRRLKRRRKRTGSSHPCFSGHQDGHGSSVTRGESMLTDARMQCNDAVVAQAWLKLQRLQVNRSPSLMAFRYYRGYLQSQW